MLWPDIAPGGTFCRFYDGFPTRNGLGLRCRTVQLHKRRNENEVQTEDDAVPGGTQNFLQAGEQGPQTFLRVYHVNPKGTRERMFDKEEPLMKDGSMEVRKRIRELANRVEDEMVLRRVWKILERAYNSQ